MALPAGAPRPVAGSKRALLVGLRVLTLAGRSRSCCSSRSWSRSQRETVQSHLAIVLDDSESMKFSDPYTDESKAAEIASEIEARVRGRAIAGGAAARDAAADLVKNGSAAEPGGTRPRPGALPLRPRVGGPARRRANRRGRARSTTSSRTGRSRRWAMRFTACWPAIAASRSPAWSWRPTAGPTPAKIRCAPSRRPSGRIFPIFAIAAGADEGPRNVRLAEIEVSPVVFVRDPMTLAVVVEARGLRDAEATIVLEQRINEGEWEAVGNQRVVLGEDGILKRTTFRITPKVVGQYEFRARVEDAGPELTHGRQRRDRRGEGRPPADPRAR